MEALAEERHHSTTGVTEPEHTKAASAQENKVNVHPFHGMRVDTRSGLNRAAQDIGILLWVFEQGAQVTDDQEAHTLLVAARQSRGGKGLGDEVCGPATQFDVGVRRGERQDTDHDLRVVGLRVAQYGLLCFVQLLELVAHGLHVGGRHDGQGKPWACRRKGAAVRGRKARTWIRRGVYGEDAEDRRLGLLMEENSNLLHYRVWIVGLEEGSRQSCREKGTNGKINKSCAVSSGCRVHP